MRRVLEVTKHFGIPSCVVVNKYDLNTDMTDKIKQLSKDYNVEFLGVVPYDKKVTEAQINKLSVVEFVCGPITESIDEIWQKVSSKF